MKKSRTRLSIILTALTTIASLLSVPFASAQSPEIGAEWALFNQILLIGIVVGVVVFGLMFYAIVRYRERPQQAGAN